MVTADIAAVGLRFGEGPRWHNGRLWFSDFFDHAVRSFGGGGDLSVEVQLDAPQRPSGLGWLPDGRLIFVSMLDRRVVRREHDGSLVMHADLADLAGGNVNDMVVSATGNAYVGNFGFDFERAVADRIAGRPATIRRAPASLVRVAPNGATSVAAEGLEFPNGTVITPDHTTLIVAESFGARLTAFTLSADGTLTNRRVWANLPGVAPDGIACNALGQVWVANSLKPECLLVAEGGEIIERVATSHNAYACMLGGPDGTTLFILTCADGRPEACMQHRTGRIETAQVEVASGGWPGVPNEILHLTTADAWARGDDLFEPASLATDGYIHCTAGPERMLTVANAFYRNDPDDFVVVRVDTAALDSDLLFEAPPGSDALAGTTYFPHLYGPLPRSAVLSVRSVQRAVDGTFVGFETN